MTPLQTIEIETGPQPTASIILLHGLGADGNDFVPLASELDLGAAGPVRFVFPHAPVMPVTINNGYPMRAWYDILGADLVQREDQQGLRRSLQQVEQLLEQEKARGTAAGRIVLAGFSQGCAVALLTGLRHSEALAGIVGLSGYLPLADSTADERHEANAGTPIFLAHGQSDEVIAIDRAQQSLDRLRELGNPVQWQVYPMAHSVCQEEIADLGRWLRRVLAQP